MCSTRMTRIKIRQLPALQTFAQARGFQLACKAHQTSSTQDSHCFTLWCVPSSAGVSAVLFQCPSSCVSTARVLHTCGESPLGNNLLQIEVLSAYALTVHWVKMVYCPDWVCKGPQALLGYAYGELFTFQSSSSWARYLALCTLDSASYPSQVHSKSFRIPHRLARR